MNRYICGICRKQNKSFISTRKGLRDHLKQEHFIKVNISNSGTTKRKQGERQSYWIVEEVI